jgi:uncharacterized protein (TIGR03435 family)
MSRNFFRLNLLGILLCFLGITRAQTAPAAVPEFVAAIKPHKPTPVKGVGRVGMSFSGTQARAQNMSAYGLIAFAYDIDTPSGIRGGQDWAPSDTFDIELKAEADAALSRDQFRPIFKALLADRFKLAVQKTTVRERRYALVVTKNGPKLKESAPDATKVMKISGSDYVELTASKWTMADLARQISYDTRQNVVDQTGLAGSYDFKLLWTGESKPNPAYPVLLIALQEQLGLKLESAMTARDVLTIDHIERPSPN